MKNNLHKTLAVLTLAAAFGSAFSQVAPPEGGPPARPDDGPRRGPGRPPIGGARSGVRWLLQPRVRAELGLTPIQVERIQALMPPAPRDGRNGPGAPPVPREGRDPGDRAGQFPPMGGGANPPLGAGGPPAARRTPGGLTARLSRDPVPTP